MPLRGLTKNNLINKVLTFEYVNSFHHGVFRKGYEDDSIGFYSVFVNPRFGVADIAIGDKRYWGCDLPQELALRLLIFSFGSPGVVNLRSDVDVNNRSS